MGLFKEFKTSAKETEGVVIRPAGPNDDGTIPEFIIAFKDRSNQNYAKAIERATRPYRRLIDLETLNPKIADEIQMKVFAETILLGWNNVQDEKNQPIPFNSENALNLLKALPHLWHELDAQSQKVSLFCEDAKDADAKN